MPSADIFGEDQLSLAFVQCSLTGATEVQSIRDQAPRSHIMPGGDRLGEHNDAEGCTDLLRTDAPPVLPPPRGVTRQHSEAGSDNHAPWKEAIVGEPTDSADVPVPPDMPSD